jgi:subtilisin family serine protease
MSGRKYLWGVLALVFVLIFPAFPEEEYVPGEVIVGLRPGAARIASEVLASSLRTYGGELLATDLDLSAALVRVPTGQERSFIAGVRGLSDVTYVEPNYIAYALDTPNDLYLSMQWGLEAINAFSAWDAQKGDKKIVVAVVDTGVDYKHPDLAEAYVQGGYDFVDDDDDPHPKGKGLLCPDAHGTHVAGIIAAVSNNKVGVAGVAQVSILAERVLGCDGSGTYWNVARGIKHAADKGAKIINLSLGGSASSNTLLEAVRYAYQKGVLIVAAAGNSAKPPVIYPAAYEEVVAVSAVDKDKQLAAFSSYGPQVELAAPGVLVLSTITNNWYDVMSGTSMATPHVAGAAALVWSANSTLSRDEVRKILQETAVDLGSPGRDDKFGYGLVDANKAVAKAREKLGSRPPSEGVPGGTWSISTTKKTYSVGERISASYTVINRAEVSIYRVGASPQPEAILQAIRSPGQYDLAPAPVAQNAGVEALVLRAKQDDGSFINVGCFYSVGVATPLAEVSVDRGCGSSYRIGDMCTITIEARDRCSVTLYDFATDGTMSSIATRSLAAGEKFVLTAKVTGPAGVELLVLRAESSQGQITTALCQFTIRK